MRLTRSGERYELRFSYDANVVARVKAIGGWRFDPTNPKDKHWYTENRKSAAPFVVYATSQELKTELSDLATKRESDLATSRAVSSDVQIPVPAGLDYLPFQKAGIQYALGRKNTLIADSMGLGKTIQALGIINATENIKRVLVICPASLRLNWKREAERWLVNKNLSISVAFSSNPFPLSDIVIINYDILAKFQAQIQSVKWDLLIVDECHYVKNPKAKRSLQVYAIQANRKVFLTGTPILNRPIELFPIINNLDPEAFPNIFSFGKQFCNGFRGRYGWDFSGVNESQLPVLQERLRASIMVRRLKEEVLKELPSKTRQVIELEPNGCLGLVKEEQQAVLRQEELLAELRAQVELAKAGTHEEYEAAVMKLRRGSQVAFTEMSALRHRIALAKVPYVIEHVRDAIESGEKIVLFAHHKDVIQALAAAFPNSVTLTGDTSLQDRQAAVDAFQTDDSVNPFIGSISAAGVGLNLTKGSHVISVEGVWTPAIMNQAEDRCHRLGQTKNVLVQHIVFDGTLDAKMAQILVEKQRVADAALDTRTEEIVLPEPETEEAATKRTSQEKVAEEALGVTESLKAAVLDGLRILAGLDWDSARELNGVGFNKIDTHIGKSLASNDRLTAKQTVLGRKILYKYHRQLPDSINDMIR